MKKRNHNITKIKLNIRTSESNLHKNLNNFKEVHELNNRIQSLEDELNEIKFTSSQEIDLLMTTIRDLNEKNINNEQNTNNLNKSNK